MNHSDKRIRGPELKPHQIVLRPLITEKSTHQSQHRNAYPFEVNPWATKDEIKAAIQELFNVRVQKVRTQNRMGKRVKRRIRVHGGRQSHWKKAIVMLHPEDSISFF